MLCLRARQRLVQCPAQRQNISVFFAMLGGMSGLLCRAVFGELRRLVRRGACMCPTSHCVVSCFTGAAAVQLGRRVIVHLNNGRSKRGPKWVRDYHIDREDELRCAVPAAITRMLSRGLDLVRLRRPCVGPAYAAYLTAPKEDPRDLQEDLLRWAHEVTHGDFLYVWSDVYALAFPSLDWPRGFEKPPNRWKTAQGILTLPQRRPQ